MRVPWLNGRKCCQQGLLECWSTAVSSVYFQQIEINLLGPFFTSQAKGKCISTSTGHITHYAEIPSLQKAAENVASFFNHQAVLWHRAHEVSIMFHETSSLQSSCKWFCTTAARPRHSTPKWLHLLNIWIRPLQICGWCRPAFNTSPETKFCLSHICVQYSYPGNFLYNFIRACLRKAADYDAKCHAGACRRWRP